MSKSVIAQQIYNELIGIGATKDEIIAEFRTNPLLSMTESGATTYFYNCKRVAAGGKFNVAAGESTRVREVHDNSPDVEDNRPLYTVVTPGDSECGKMLVVASTHSFFDPQSALKQAKYDQFVVQGLPEIGDNVDMLTQYSQPA